MPRPRNRKLFANASKGKKIVRRKTRTKDKKMMTNPLISRFSSMHYFVPPSFHTKCGVMQAGITQFGATNPLINGLRTGYIQISANSLHLPFYSTLVQGNSAVLVDKWITPGTGSTAGLIYGGSNPYSVQPQGFSNICSGSSVYNAYRVIGSRIIFRMDPIGPDEIMICINTVIGGATYNSTIWTAAEAPNASKVVTFAGNKYEGQVVKSVSMPTVFGVSKTTLMADESYAGNFNTSPANEACWNITYQTTTNNAPIAGIAFVIKVEYDVVFYNPNTGGLNDT